MVDCRVVADHLRSYATPIVAKAGDRLKTGRRDNDAPGWNWCEHPDSRLGGWVPEDLLDLEPVASAAIIRRDYDAMELTVRVGDTVEALQAMAGWTWCRTAGGTGWIPTHKLVAIDATARS